MSTGKFTIEIHDDAALPFGGSAEPFGRKPRSVRRIDGVIPSRSIGDAA
jgi:hypothetical protein